MEERRDVDPNHGLLIRSVRAGLLRCSRLSSLVRSFGCIQCWDNRGKQKLPSIMVEFHGDEKSKGWLTARARVNRVWAVTTVFSLCNAPA